MKLNTTNSPGAKNIITTLLALFFLYSTDAIMIDATKKAGRWPVQGVVTVVNTKDHLRIAKSLPLAKFTPNAHQTAQPQLNENIFLKPTTPQRSTTKVTAKLPVVADEIDYAAILSKQLTINTISQHGAVINGRFVKLFRKIETINIVDQDKNKVAIIILETNTDNQTVTVSIDGDSYQLRME
jgi:hypothetical protein